MTASYNSGWTDWTDSANDKRGFSVAVSGNALVVASGLVGEDSGTTVIDCGTVDTVKRSSISETSWSSFSEFFSPTPIASGAFGSSVALNDVGSVMACGETAGSGGVYIYDNNGTGWTVRGSKLIGAGLSTNDLFGCAVSLSADGNTLVVGASAKNGTYTDQGAVYIYDRSGTSWVQRGGILGNNIGYSGFGSSVAISGDGNTLVVGAENLNNPYAKTGGIYTYTRNGTGWTLRGSVLTPAAAVANDLYGCKIAISGDGSVLALSKFNGDVLIYDMVSGSWVNRSQNSIATYSTEVKGASVALSANGSRLFIGYSSYSTSKGIVREFKYNKTPSYTGSNPFYVLENTLTVGNAAFTDPDGDALTYAISGADASKFNISPTGAITFKSAPNFENPTDQG